jgi:quercetin 2,3-dioxygenase
MQTKIRRVVKIVTPQRVTEGAGVKLQRSIATQTLDNVDPFLLFDHFGSKDPEDYLKGFPMHPHRGIETVTYMIDGTVSHKDSIGNSGTIGAGDVQWMTSGRGIMHEEMPQAHNAEMVGFQLWVNLPAKLKMTEPRYQDVPSAKIPKIRREDGVTIRVIAGEIDGTRGPVTEIMVEPVYLDVAIPPHGEFTQPVQEGHAAFAYVFEGGGIFGKDAKDKDATISNPQLVVFGDGNSIAVQTGKQAVRFLLVSGKPLSEPIARYGPFVMNTREEIEQTLQDLRDGTFVR